MNTVTGLFDVQGDIIKIAPYGEGHIHETYLIETENHCPDYILQKINRNVFRDVPAMMRNIQAVTQHLRDKLLALPGHDPDRESLQLVLTRAGDSFYQDDQGNYWRVFIFIPGTVTYQNLPDKALAREAGRAVGNFQLLLSDLKKTLEVTIPGFHNINFRIRQYAEAKRNDPAGRVDLVKEDLTFVENRFDRMMAYYADLNDQAEIRVTHNDTKLNNILFDRDHKALCLIDLDTVMPGFVHFDYGDALRTLANTAAEDERDLSKVKFNRKIYQGFTRGYLEAVESFLTDAERKLLPFAPIYLTFIIGLRFLTDYLNGDVYYRIHYPDHNLIRARVQFRLVSEMEKAVPFSEYRKI